MSTHEATTDAELIALAVAGDRAALSALVERHQPFVFNVALKMFGDRHEAEDVTQEVFIRLLTSLGSFRGESAFTTWLYRITANHVIKTRRRGREIHVAVGDFAPYFDAVDAVPDEPWTPASEGDTTVDELRVRCTSGMLLCLDREQRLVFILGAMLGISHTAGAEALGTTPGNFRVRLHRARTQLSSWMQRRCGLVNKDNPCRCAKKTAGFVRLGFVDPQRLEFTRDRAEAIDRRSREQAPGVMASVAALHEQVFREHPPQRSRTDVVAALLRDETLRRFFELEH